MRKENRNRYLKDHAQMCELWINEIGDIFD